MAYKGSDLDLQTPYGHDAGEDAGAQMGWPLFPELSKDGPIPVDATLLACCNAAYDAAVFHGTRDVRVEHLLYALTRVEAARDILEQHGLRTQQLRRDAAAAIADEVPAGGSTVRMPKASAEFENVLRRAAGRADQDSVPASVHDLMRAVLSYGRDAPATSLLLRSASDPNQLERWAASQPMHKGTALLPQAAAQKVLTRLENVEAAMQTLAAEVAADRAAMINLMREIQSDLRAMREENAAARESIVLEKIEDVGRSVSGLSERFEAIRAFGPADGLAGRMTAIESKLAEQPSAIADAISYMLEKRRADEPLRLTAEHAADRAGAAAEKMAELETVVLAQAERMEEARKTHERDLNEIFEALVKLGSNQQTLASNLESWRLDNSGDVSIVSNRLENMERALQELASPPGNDSDGESRKERTRSFKRWLHGTGRMLPSTWRTDAAAVRESFRMMRRAEKP